MTARKQTAVRQPPRWWEAAGGVHNIIQSIYVLLVLALLFTGWCVRQEIRAAQDDDRFAAIAEKQTAAQQEFVEIRKEIGQIHSDTAALREGQIRMEAKFEENRNANWINRNAIWVKKGR